MTNTPSKTEDSTPTGPRGMTDVRDMLVVHTALLRELRLAPAVALWPASRRSRQHLELVLDLLEHHHHGEDTLLWPLLEARAPASTHDAVTEHEAIHVLIRQARTDLSPWGQVLADTFTLLHATVAAHLDEEERNLLPLAAQLLTSQEWHRIGQAAVAATAKPKLALVFGMFAYEGDPDVLTMMLAAAPGLPRRLLPVLAPRVYARHARRVHLTSTP